MFPLERTFFGLTSKYMEAVYEQFFLLKHFGGWSFIEAYNLPVGLREWFINRLQKQTMTAHKEIDKSELKLNNTSFLTNAPTEVIEKEKQRISKNKNLLKELEKQIKKLSKTKD